MIQSELKYLIAAKDAGTEKGELRASSNQVETPQVFIRTG
jgi:hypothetical protein